MDREHAEEVFNPSAADVAAITDSQTHGARSRKIPTHGVCVGVRHIRLVELSQWDENNSRRLLRYIESLDSGETLAPGLDDAPIPNYLQVAKSTCHSWLTENEVAEIVDEYQSGSTIQAIASKHDRCYTTILKRLRKAGVDTQPGDEQMAGLRIARLSLFASQTWTWIGSRYT